MLVSPSYPHRPERFEFSSVYMFPSSVPRSMNYYRHPDDRGFDHQVDGQQHQHGAYRIQPSDIHTNEVDSYDYTEAPRISVEGSWQQPFPAPELHGQMTLPTPQYPPQGDIHLTIPWNNSPSTPNINHFENYTPSRSNAIISSQHALGPHSNTSEGSLSRQGSEQPSPSYFGPPHFTPPPTTPTYSYGVLQDHIPVDGYREQLRLFRDALQLPMASLAGPFIPQKIYVPHTNSDRRRYVEEIELQPPIYFWMQNPEECGIPLTDALHCRARRMRLRDDPVFEGRGPSISVRIQWPGYQPWSRQIPTKDFRSPPGPITRAKLAKNVAKCVERFLEARSQQVLEDDVDPRWRVGPGPNQIKFDDLILVSMHHVSMGSWQPHLRLRHPFPS